MSLGCYEMAILKWMSRQAEGAYFDIDAIQFRCSTVSYLQYGEMQRILIGLARDGFLYDNGDDDFALTDMAIYQLEDSKS